MRPWLWRATLVVIVAVGGALGADTQRMADAIRAEALRPMSDSDGRPLPLAASWNSGVLTPRIIGFDPEYQLGLIERGHHLLPWLAYAHAPLGERRGVRIEVPGTKGVEMDVPVGGAFRVIDEAAGNSSRHIGDGESRDAN